MSKEIKKLYEFEAIETTTIEVEKEETRPEDGKKIKVMDEVKQEKTRKFFIRKPNRILYENSELFYGSYLSKLIKAGLMTVQMLQKRFEDDDGIFSKREKAEYKELNEKYIVNEIEISKIERIDESKRTESSKKNLENLIKYREELRDKIITIEMSQGHLYEQTAEHKSKLKCLFWWLLFLAYEEVSIDGKPVFKPIFLPSGVKEGGDEDTYDFRALRYDEIEEDENEFLLKVIRKIIYLITSWYSNSIKNESDFENLAKTYDNKMKEIEKSLAENSIDGQEGNSDENSDENSVGSDESEDSKNLKENKEPQGDKEPQNKKEKRSTKKSG